MESGNGLRRAEEIARSVLRKYAGRVDREGRFPQESVDALRDAGVMGWLANTVLADESWTMEEIAAIASALGEECLSTALIWAMHTQQTAVLAEHMPLERQSLEAISAGALIASVTTELETGADMTRSASPVTEVGNGIRVVRKAPIVSYAAEAEFFLAKMLRTSVDDSKDVCLVLVKRSDGSVQTKGEWLAMGMRGTNSVAMEIDVTVPRDRILDASYREILVKTLVPAGHIGWSAAWLGAVRGIFRKLVRGLRGRKAKRLESELFVQRLGALRLQLEMLEALQERAVRKVDGVRQNLDAGSRPSEPALSILLNNLKVGISQGAFSMANGFVELLGLFEGYLENEELPIERVFRDLRSAELMFGNDRLLQASGKLAVFEQSNLGRLWRE